MDDNIQNYRQPMVTSIGIILGFVLGFTGTWAKEPVEKTEVSDYFTSVGLLLSVVLLIVSLFRILNNKTHENPAVFYQKTLKIFISGICFAFLGILISIFQTIFNN